MAFRKKTYKKKRRGTRSRASRTQTSKRIVAFKNPSPLPMKFKATMRYSEPRILIPAPSDAFNGTWIFSANGIYDPDFTGTGHQPSGFDQLIAMYDHFVVIGAKAIVTFVNSDTSDSMICGIDVRDSINAESDVRVVIESGTAKYVNLSPRDAGTNQATVTYSVNPARFLGRSKPLSDPNLKGSASANPVEQCYFHMFNANLDDQGTQGTPVTANVVIEYQVMFIEPKPVGLS